MSAAREKGGGGERVRGDEQRRSVSAPCRSCGCGGGGSAHRAHTEGGVGGSDGEALEASHSSIHPGSNVQSPSLAETLKQS